eukprot:scaffold6397_cov121-Isochrysis_galbana.AAC.4
MGSDQVRPGGALECPRTSTRKRACRVCGAAAHVFVPGPLAAPQGGYMSHSYLHGATSIAAEAPTCQFSQAGTVYVVQFGEMVEGWAHGMRDPRLSESTRSAPVHPRL